VQMPHQITLRFRGVFEADHKMIVIGRRRPKPVELADSFSPTRKLCRAKDPALRRNRKWRSMQRCRRDDIGTVRQ
jgi:hypothetical protein